MTAAQRPAATKLPETVNLMMYLLSKKQIVANYGAAHVYEAASVGEPELYRGYVGYEQSGKLPVVPVTVADFCGAVPFSTQSSNIAMRSNRLGICAAGITRPSPSLV